MTKELLPNTYYNLGECAGDLNITLAGGGSEDDSYKEYMFSFRALDTLIILPDNIKWAYDDTPLFFNGVTYDVSIVNNIAISGKEDIQ